MNEREVQAFLSGLPKHVPQRTAKFRAGADHQRQPARVIRRGRGGKRTRRHLRRGAGPGATCSSIPSTRGSASASATCWWPSRCKPFCAARRRRRCAFGKRKRWLRRCAATRRWQWPMAALCNAKIQFLLSRIEMLTMQSCRGKVLAFLLAEKREDGVILLRGTRDELASRLSVSRAALYRELSALQRRGLSGSRRKQASGSEHIGA